MRGFWIAILGILSIVRESQATHIVGGGFSYAPVSGNTYRITLTLFFDFINGNTQAKDNRATCHIFQRGTNQYMDSIRLGLTDSSRFLAFSNPVCSRGVNLRTQVLVYANNITLSPNRYNSPQGYYIVWERCCRNGIISNISSPAATGQTFYMEFPPVIRNAQSFFNRSPVFGLIQADYPCVANPFRMAFGATDADGDSLVYELVSPLRGNSTTNFPRDIPPEPAPYPLVTWRNASYSSQNPIPGTPGLRVDFRTGELSLTASQTGLFVFSVRCSEFRNGQKIGEVRREMQLPVIECPFNNPPDIVIRQSPSGPVLGENDTLYITGGAREVCPTLSMADRERGQPVSIRIVPLSPNAPAGLSAVRNLVLGQSSDTVFSTFCVPACSFAPPEAPWKVRFVASDFGCGGSKSDSVTLNLVVLRPPAPSPVLSVTSGLIRDTLTVIQTQGLEIPFRAQINQVIPMRIYSRLEDSLGNPVSGFSLSLPNTTGSGTLNSRFNWPDICEVPDALPLRLTTIAESDFCGELKRDTVILWIRIVPKDLVIQLSSNYQGANPLAMKEQESVRFTLTGRLNEARPIQLTALGSLTSQPGFVFRGGFGTGQVQDLFQYAVICGGVSGDYEILFRASTRFCNLDYVDTLRYRFQPEYEPDTVGIAPNLLTANDDQKNDALILEPISPKETCANQFDFVEVYNRWGQRIFFSRDRNFRWEPRADALGVYFYAIHFKNKVLKSWITVVGGSEKSP